MPKSATLDDLERPLRTLFQNTCVFWSAPRTWMKTDPCYQQRRCSPMILVSGSIRFVRIFAESSLERGVKRQWGFQKRQLLVLSLTISSEALVVRPTLLYSRPIIQSLAAFTLTPKYVTLSDRERSFYVKFCFVLSSPDQQLLFFLKYGKRHYIYSRHR